MPPWAQWVGCGARRLTRQGRVSAFSGSPVSGHRASALGPKPTSTPARRDKIGVAPTRVRDARANISKAAAIKAKAFFFTVMNAADHPLLLRGPRLNFLQRRPNGTRAEIAAPIVLLMLCRGRMRVVCGRVERLSSDVSRLSGVHWASIRSAEAIPNEDPHTHPRGYAGDQSGAAVCLCGRNGPSGSNTCPIRRWPRNWRRARFWPWDRHGNRARSRFW